MKQPSEHRSDGDTTGRTSDEVIGQASQQTVSLFGEPKFSLPDRTPKKAKNGGIPIIRVEYLLGGVLNVETAIWENEDWNEREECFDLSYSMSFPRGIRTVQGDPEAQGLVTAFREKVVNEGMAFYDLAMEAKGKAGAAGAQVTPGRLVRQRKPTETEKARLQ